MPKDIISCDNVSRFYYPVQYCSDTSYKNVLRDVLIDGMNRCTETGLILWIATFQVNSILLAFLIFMFVLFCATKRMLLVCDLVLS